MCALVPPSYPSFSWPYGDNSFYENDDVTNMFADFPLPDLTVDHQNVSSENNKKLVDNREVKQKLNHNESERVRRKKINAMFSSLRSCLPTTSQTQKLSVSATVSHALKYIPELQDEVKELLKKKEELSFQISGQRDHVYADQNCNPDQTGVTSYVSTVSATRLGETEVMVLISSLQTAKCSFGNVLSGVEEDGLVLMDASSSRSQGERLFYTLHLQTDKCKIDSEELSDKLLHLYEKCENLCT